MIFSREEQAVDIGFMLEILPRLLRVLLTTLQISVVALLLGTLFGLLFGHDDVHAAVLNEKLQPSAAFVFVNNDPAARVDWDVN